MSNVCPVCGYPKLAEPPHTSRGGHSFEICPSCGFQFGVSDDDRGISYQQWRKQWITDGMLWSSATKKPFQWSPREQLKNISC